jgi:signal peptidase I
MFKIRSALREQRGFIVILLSFGLLRVAVADYNPVPSGSMRPTILEGDVVLVNRLAYDLKVPLTDFALARLGEPVRGDIITFNSPRDGVRLIKRVVGLPGDVVSMRDKKLSINGVPLSYVPRGPVTEKVGDDAAVPGLRVSEQLGPRAHDVLWLDGVQGRDNFGPLKIPADQYLMLGDNRDNSADSRYIGLVPRRLLIARAERVLVSVDPLRNFMPRVERLGASLYP